MGCGQSCLARRFALDVGDGDMGAVGFVTVHQICFSPESNQAEAALQFYEGVTLCPEEYEDISVRIRCGANSEVN